MNAAEGHTDIIHLEGSLRTKGVCFHFKIYTLKLLTLLQKKKKKLPRWLEMISNKN